MLLGSTDRCWALEKVCPFYWGKSLILKGTHKLSRLEIWSFDFLMKFIVQFIDAYASLKKKTVHTEILTNVLTPWYSQTFSNPIIHWYFMSKLCTLREKIPPWGTPDTRLIGLNMCLPILTIWLLPVINEWNRPYNWQSMFVTDRQSYKSLTVRAVFSCWNFPPPYLLCLQGDYKRMRSVRQLI